MTSAVLWVRPWNVLRYSRANESGRSVSGKSTSFRPGMAARSRRGATPLPPRTGKLLLGVLLVVFVLAVAWIMLH